MTNGSFRNADGEPTTLVVFADQGLVIDGAEWRIVNANGDTVRAGTIVDGPVRDDDHPVCGVRVALASDPSRSGPCVLDPGHDGDHETTRSLADPGPA